MKIPESNRSHFRTYSIIRFGLRSAALTGALVPGLTEQEHMVQMMREGVGLKEWITGMQPAGVFFCLYGSYCLPEWQHGFFFPEWKVWGARKNLRSIIFQKKTNEIRRN